MHFLGNWISCANASQRFGFLCNRPRPPIIGCPADTNSDNWIPCVNYRSKCVSCVNNLFVNLRGGFGSLQFYSLRPICQSQWLWINPPPRRGVLLITPRGYPYGGRVGGRGQTIHLGIATHLHSPLVQGAPCHKCGCLIGTHMHIVTG